jgi:putative intracellular protease/amidase
MARHRMVVLLLEQVLPLDFAIPMHVFAREAPEVYDVVTATVDGAPVGLAGGSSVVPDGGIAALRAADTVVVPGWAGCCGTRPAAAPGWCRSAPGRSPSPGPGCSTG